MTFAEFERELRNEVDNWLSTWLEENKISPEEFPLEMDSGEWWEQFISSQS